MSVLWVNLPPLDEERQWSCARTKALREAVRAYRTSAATLDEMAARLEADLIDGPAFVTVENRLGVEMLEAKARIDRVRELFDCQGEA